MEIHKKVVSFVMLIMMCLMVCGTTVISTHVPEAQAYTQASNGNGNEQEKKQMDFSDIDSEKIVKDNFNDADFAKDVTRVRSLLQLDVEEVGTISAAKHFVAVGLSTMAGMLFSVQVTLTFLASLTLNWSENMTWLDSFAEAISNFMQGALGENYFEFSDGNSVVFYMIFFAMIGVVFSFAKMRVSEGVGKFVRIILLVVLSLFLLTQGARAFNSLNHIAKDVSNGFADATGGRPDRILWDVNAIRPWKILEFEGMEFTGNSMSGTSQSEEGDSAAEQVANAVSNVGEFDWEDETKTRKRWEKIKHPYASTGIVGAYAYENPNAKDTDGWKMWRLLQLESGARSEAVDSMIDDDIGNFELSAGVQGVRLGTAFMTFIISLPLTLVTLLIACVIIALKILAMILFFMWPVVILISFAKNDFDSLKKWFLSVSMTFVSAAVLQFLFAVIMSAIKAFHGGPDSTLTFGYWFISSMISGILLVAMYWAYPKVMGFLRPDATGSGRSGGLLGRGTQRAMTAASVASMMKSLKEMRNMKGGDAGGASDEKASRMKPPTEQEHNKDEEDDKKGGMYKPDEDKPNENDESDDKFGNTAADEAEDGKMSKPQTAEEAQRAWEESDAYKAKQEKEAKKSAKADRREARKINRMRKKEALKYTVKEAAKGAGKGIGGIVARGGMAAASQVGAAAKGTGRFVGNTGGKVAAAGGRYARDAVASSKAGQAGAQAARTTVEKAKAAGQKGKEMGQTAVDKTKATGQMVASKAKDAGAKVSNAAKTTKEGAEKKSQQLADKIDAKGAAKFQRRPAPKKPQAPSPKKPQAPSPPQGSGSSNGFNDRMKRRPPQTSRRRRKR